MERYFSGWKTYDGFSSGSEEEMKKIIRTFFFTFVLVMAMTGIVSAETNETTEQLYWIDGYDAYDTETGYTRFVCSTLGWSC